MAKNFFSDDNAFNYEIMIRRAYQRGRGYKGGDADVYRSLIRYAVNHEEELEAKRNNFPKKGGTSEAKKLASYNKSLKEVSHYMTQAISAVLKRCDEDFSPRQKKELGETLNLLVEPTLEKIDRAIKCADVIMLEIGLYPG